MIKVFIFAFSFIASLRQLWLRSVCMMHCQIPKYFSVQLNKTQQFVIDSIPLDDDADIVEGPVIMVPMPEYPI